MWRQPILARFERLPDNLTIENKFYGVYNTILAHECFTEDTFTVEPQYALPAAQVGGIGAVDFVVTFVVVIGDSPVLFVEVKPPTHLKHVSTRAAADAQMRDRFKALYDLCALPRLYGISALGKKISIYTMDVENGTVIPEELPSSPTRVSDSAPTSRWELDVTSEEGYQKFMEIVIDIKHMARASLL